METGVRFTKRRNPTANQTDEAMEWEESWGSLRRRVGTAHTSASLITRSHCGDWREPFASVQDGSPLGLAEVAGGNLVVSRAGLAAATAKTSLVRLCRKGREIMTAWRSPGPRPSGSRHSRK